MTLIFFISIFLFIMVRLTLLHKKQQRQVMEEKWEKAPEFGGINRPDLLNEKELQDLNEAKKDYNEYMKKAIRAAPSKVKKTGRNEPCWCGSGKKTKHCHKEALREDGFIISDEIWQEYERRKKSLN